MAEDHRFHLAIGSQFENIELVQVVLNDSLDRMGMDGEARYWVDIAVREAVANAIKHGNAQDPAKRVRVDAGIEGDTLVIRIEDEGEGFDPARLGDPRDPENLLKPSGRGIFYMRSFMDGIEYGSRPGGGTVVTLRKRLSRPAEEAPEGPARASQGS